MSLAKKEHRKTKPSAKRKRIPTQRQKGKGFWPDYDERENVFFTPTQTTYADVLTIRNPTAAEESITWMAEEYKRASGGSKVKGVQPSQKWVNHVHKAMDNTAKRARLSQKRPNISSKENIEMGKVANLYEKALAGDRFGNYYSAKRMGATMVPKGLGTGTVPAKGDVGGPLIRFRTVKVTAKGNRIMAWKPYRLISKSNTQKADAKAKELRAAGFAVRVVREGRMRYVYAHAEGRGKWKYQPADIWFIKALARKRGKKSEKRKYERTRKASYRTKKTKEIKAADKAAKKAEKARIVEKAKKAKARQDAKKKAADYEKAAKRAAVKDRMAKARAVKEEKAAKKAARVAKKAKKEADKARMEKARAGKSKKKAKK